MRAPFPYFGGKSAAASMIWERFGDVRNYVEPFCGSMAVLLCRPHWPFTENRIETVNDADCFLANFWRALRADPEHVAYHADWPVNEADLYARHLWLVNVGRGHVEKLRTDPDWFDAKIAGWWVWGCCQWIGSGWCHHPEWQQRPHLGDSGMGIHRPSQKRPHLGNSGMGIHRPSQQLPHLGDSGMGIHRPSQKLPHLGNSGRGIHRPSQKLPHLGNSGRGGQLGYGDSPTEPEASEANELTQYLCRLSDRLRRVRVCCGDWSRVCGPTPTVKQGLTGVFLDPPYADTADRKSDLYACDDLSVAHAVREWCIANGDDPRLRICLAGYEGEHAMPSSWKAVAWKARGGYGSQGDGESTNGRDNSTRERLWFSPHCIDIDRPRERQRDLMEAFA